MFACLYAYVHISPRQYLCYFPYSIMWKYLYVACFFRFLSSCTRGPVAAPRALITSFSGCQDLRVYLKHLISLLLWCPSVFKCAVSSRKCSEVGDALSPTPAFISKGTGSLWPQKEAPARVSVSVLNPNPLRCISHSSYFWPLDPLYYLNFLVWQVPSCPPLTSLPNPLLSSLLSRPCSHPCASVLKIFP